ncbi:MAG: zf-HC2 domain-containing protein [Thermodesulfovibrionales bacterium]|nr:zf-HC2 domain-containing protein [Thermodesulfovibrionales bacterium]
MKLDHNKIKEILPKYLEGSLPEEMRNDVKAHLKDCQDCRDELSFITELVRIEVPDPGDLFWEILPQKVRGAVETKRDKRFSLKSLFLRRLPAVAAIAALLLLVLIYTNTKKKGIPELEQTLTPSTVTVLDYSDITEKDIPIITERLAVDELYLCSENFTGYSYYVEFASLDSKEMDSLYEALKKEQGTGG